jgi:hypothetical protein
MDLDMYSLPVLLRLRIQDSTLAVRGRGIVDPKFIAIRAERMNIAVTAQ